MRTLSETAFGRVYATDAWGEGSGTGSRGQIVTDYAAVVKGLADTNGWKTATDFGCGDGVVAGAVSPLFDKYCGIDPVPECVAACRKTVAGRGCRLLVLDGYAARAAIPAADVLLVKDVLQHWPNRWVVDWVRWLGGEIGGRFQAALLTHDDNQLRDGLDCPIGGYRPVSPWRYPLNALTNDKRLSASVPWQGYGKTAMLIRPRATQPDTPVVESDG